ncbi:hypothetical protein BDR26DRAFT_882983, partial [Obelidium mucronatum]
RHLSEISFISTKPSEKIFKDLDVLQVPVQNIVELCIDWLKSNKEELLVPVPAASRPAEGNFVCSKVSKTLSTIKNKLKSLLQSLAGRPFDFDEAKKVLFEDDPRHKFGSQFSSTEETLEKEIVSLVFFAKYLTEIQRLEKSTMENSRAMSQFSLII